MPAVVRRDAPQGPALDARALARRAERMLDALGLGEAELSVLLTSDARIEGLNRTHRRQAKPTDVLAFPMDDAPAARRARLLGDVVISLDTARRQARSRRLPLLEEATHLLAHGLLHLLGYDHRTDAEERRMEAAACDLLAAARHTPPRYAALLHRLRDRA
jgi:probable rRNA maturation factor